MTLKDILVHVDASDAARARLSFAVDLAERHKAHLTGIHIKPDPVLPVMDSYSALPQNFIEEQYNEIEAGVEAARKLFDGTARRASIESEWRVGRGFAADAIRRQARYCDLLIVGQRDPESTGDSGDLPDGVLLGTGRPTLIVPYIGPAKTFATNVMIAWDNGAAATRAVHDALPLLQHGAKVSVAAVNPEKTGDHGDIACADICLHLARHGVKAEAMSLHGEDVSVADVLLARAFDLGCDLIVMGGYGHSRWREFVLGGATEQMLKNMTVPVLMSH